MTNPAIAIATASQSSRRERSHSGVFAPFQPNQAPRKNSSGQANGLKNQTWFGPG